jgi:hypothetical protein
MLDTEKKIDEEEDFPEDEVTTSQGSIEDLMPQGQVDSALSNMLIGLIGATSQTLAVVCESTQEEFSHNKVKLQIFFDLVRAFPSSSIKKNVVNQPKIVGFNITKKSKRSKK